LCVEKTVSETGTFHPIPSFVALEFPDQPALCSGPQRQTRMKKLVLIVAILVLALAADAGWQIASCELANRQLEEDLRDLASRNAERIGLAAPTSDDDLRNSVIHDAKQLDIVLDPEQVSVERTAKGESSVVHLAADYTARVHLLGFSLNFRFTPSSDRTPS
jgi:hypothetical protein